MQAALTAFSDRATEAATKFAGTVAEKVAAHPLAVAPFALSGFCSIATYVVPLAFQNLVLDHFSVNLKKKYNAEWALVTGASSGKPFNF
jgi:hypothetical protein